MKNPLESVIGPQAIPLIVLDGPQSEIERLMQKTTLEKWSEDYSMYQFSLGVGMQPLRAFTVSKDTSMNDPRTKPDESFKQNPIGMLEWIYTLLHKIFEEEKNKSKEKRKLSPILLTIYDYGSFMTDPNFNSLILQMTSATGIAVKTKCTIILVVNAALQQLAPDIASQAVKINCPLPKKDEIVSMIKTLYIDANNKIPDDETLNRIAREAAGMTSTQINNAGCSSIYEHGKIIPEVIRAEIKQLLLTLPGVQLIDSNQTLKDMGGYEYAKNSCLKLISAYDKPMANPKGVLVTGPPGTGKSLLGKLLAGEVGWKCLLVAPSLLKDKYVGETGKNMARLLQLIEAVAPCVVIFDEIESAFGSHNGVKESDSSGDLLGPFLSWQAERVDCKVFILATCNRMDNLPPEATRDGRFNKRLYMGLPERKTKDQIWNIYMNKFFKGKPIPVSGYVDDTGWTGAEIYACVETAYIEDVPIEIAAKQIVPVSKRMGENTMNLILETASRSCIDADTGLPVKINVQGTFAPPPPPPIDNEPTQRQIKQKQ